MSKAPTTIRDLSIAQFWSAVERHNMKRAPFGYVEIDGGKLSVNRLNGGRTFRAQLAYLLREQAKYESANQVEKLIAQEISEPRGKEITR